MYEALLPHILVATTTYVHKQTAFLVIRHYLYLEREIETVKQLDLVSKFSYLKDEYKKLCCTNVRAVDG